MTTSVELISSPCQAVSGLSRYADTLGRHLALIDAQLDLHHQITSLPLPLRPLAKLGQLLGYDLATFFQTYPVAIHKQAGRIHHLTSENLSSALTFQSVRPVVVTVHGLFGYTLRNDPQLTMYNHLLEQWMDKRAVRGLHRADHLICVSQYIHDVVVHELGVDAGRVSVVHEAVEHQAFFPGQVDHKFYTRHDLARDRRYLLYVGSEQPRKNFLRLLRAFAKIHHSFADVELLKVGRPEYMSERYKALKLINDLGLSDSVHFCGHITDELADFYRVAEVFVFPSMFEGFGFPPLEAQACGTAVICSNTTSLPEVLGDSALLFNPYEEEALVEALHRVLTDPALADSMRRRGLANAARFRWSEVACRTLEIYEMVVERYG